MRFTKFVIASLAIEKIVGPSTSKGKLLDLLKKKEEPGEESVQRHPPMDMEGGQGKGERTSLGSKTNSDHTSGSAASSGDCEKKGGTVNNLLATLGFVSADGKERPFILGENPSEKAQRARDQERQALVELGNNVVTLTIPKLQTSIDGLKTRIDEIVAQTGVSNRDIKAQIRAAVNLFSASVQSSLIDLPNEVDSTDCASVSEMKETGSTEVASEIKATSGGGGGKVNPFAGGGGMFANAKLKKVDKPKGGEVNLKELFAEKERGGSKQPEDA